MADLPPEIASLLRRPEVKSSHYVPKFYLDQWVRSPHGLAILRVKSNIVLPKYRTTKKLACGDYYYGNWSEKKDDASQVIEHGYHGPLESVFGEALPPLYRKIKGTERLTLADKTLLAHFISHMRLRGPAMREWVKIMQSKSMMRFLRQKYAERGDAIFDDFESAEGVSLPLGTRESYKRLLSGATDEFKMEPSNALHSRLMVEGQKHKAIEMMVYKWTVHINESSRPFITSDSPVCMGVNPEFATDPKPWDLHYMFPLSPELLLELKNVSRPTDPKQITRSTVTIASDYRIDAMNSVIAISAHRDAYAHDKDYLRALADRMPEEVKRMGIEPMPLSGWEPAEDFPIGP